jgi:hypothetical protein
MRGSNHPNKEFYMSDMDTIDENAEKDEKRRIKGLWWSKMAKNELTKLACKKKNCKATRKSADEFYAWYAAQPKKCCYCGITEAEMQGLISRGLVSTKRSKNRGRHLEIERKDPDRCYDDFENLSLACCWCNNAKTDTFTAEEFKAVGEVFGRIWRQRAG